jgi:histidinol dehydrogenase
MGVVPAQVAGVAEIAVVTAAAPDGSVSDVVLAAAALLGIDEVYIAGGAQAVAALAYGTESIPRVDKIVGPGNAWVTAAKLAIYGDCGVDLPAGPSEALILADGAADPRIVAADLLCQAEHGPDSPVVLVTTSASLAAAVQEEIDRLLPSLDRADILAKALGDHGLSVLAPDLDAAVGFAERYAAEHVSIHTDDARGVAGRITAAGSVFVGHWSPESAGDYATGANHVLPTGGLARSHGPLSVDDFGSWRQVQELTREGLASLRPTITALADAEGLSAHRLAVDIRFEDSGERPSGRGEAQ